MEPVVSLQLSNNIGATYSAIFNILPLGKNAGIGNWSNTWVLSSDQLLGKQILTGSGEIIACGNPSTLLFKSKLQITRTNTRVIPFPQSEPEVTTWEGSISLVGGNMQGFLSRISGMEYPEVYSVSAVYTKTSNVDTILININNIKLYI